jgi:hypothetical protein
MYSYRQQITRIWRWVLYFFFYIINNIACLAKYGPIKQFSQIKYIYICMHLLKLFWFTYLCYWHLHIHVIHIYISMLFIFTYSFYSQSLNPAHCEVYSVQHCVIKFVSDLWKVSGFLRVLQFPPPIKLTATI